MLWRVLGVGCCCGCLCFNRCCCCAWCGALNLLAMAGCERHSTWLTASLAKRILLVVYTKLLFLHMASFALSLHSCRNSAAASSATRPWRLTSHPPTHLRMRLHCCPQSHGRRRPCMRSDTTLHLCCRLDMWSGGSPGRSHTSCLPPVADCCCCRLLLGRPLVDL